MRKLIFFNQPILSRNPEFKVNGSSVLRFLSALTFIFFTLGLSAQTEDSIIAKEGIIRLMPPQSPNTGGFLKLSNSTGKDIKLIRAEGNFSESVELHDMKMEGGKMMMRPVPFITIPANSSVELKPGSLHIMFMGLKTPLKNEEEKKVTLFFDTSKSLSVTMVVKDIPMMKK